MNTRNLRADSAGVVFVEYLVVSSVTLMSFLATWQSMDYYAADLIIRRAASAGARAAAVVLPDDPKLYPGEPATHAYVGQRKDDIELAVAQILIASPHFSADFSVELRNEAGEALVSETSAGSEGPTPEGSKVITAVVTAAYDCFKTMPGMSIVCAAFPNTMVAKSTVAYQGASYIYGY